ncbi:MAG: alpha-mannosidase [Chthonomonadetes bacterium]|nr:alpha-mannosidase [Chthonomonadetes bacterium]
MLKHPELTLARVERFIRNELLPRLWEQQIPMQAAVYRPEGKFPPEEAPQKPYVPIQPGYQWGPVWSDAWFRFVGVVPPEWRGKTVCALIDCGAEAVVWVGNDPRQGIDENHREYLVIESAQGGEEVTLYVQATGMNPHVSVDARPIEPPPTPFTFRYANLAVWDREMTALCFDMQVALEVLKELPPNEPRRMQLLYALNEAVNAFNPDDRKTITLCQKIVAKTYNKSACPSAHQISAIGHAHIDTAWLWPLERTQQKCIHTFATALRLMDMYPEYKFICSQAQQYAWVKELAPRLYERIKQKVREGQWEIAGSMWVEADCNITGGESLVRQILYGKRFWMQEFGVETVDLWLPDVFGYAACLPQILQKAGIRYFMTQKISWNQVNRFPHHTFLWQGIDGTRIFTHFPPADTYNGKMTPRELMYHVHNFREHDRANRALYIYGYGDGGGGPTMAMLEYARRLRDVEGMPRVTLEFARDFFAKAEAEAKDLPVWVGELYLELHRGTYTTQARNKRHNRQCEFLLRDAEFLACVRPDGLKNYPAQELERAWKLVLLNQFHDIIPGSSVNEVYRDSERDYAEVREIAERIIQESLQAIGERVPTAGMKMPVLVVRTTPGTSTPPLVAVPLPEGFTPGCVVLEDEIAPVQIVEEKGQRYALIEDVKGYESYSYTVYDLREKPRAEDEENGFKVSPRLLDNGVLRVEFDKNGLISRIYDHSAMREVLIPGEKGNQLQLFEDKPLYWDAWDIDIFYQEKGRVITELDSVEVVEQGPLRAAIRFTRTFGNSRIVQTVRLARESRRLDFVTEVDWHEEYKLLKVAFPVAINSQRATYEIQYGHVERPTHYNTSWDMARFEVAAQKWVDISEHGYGVALLNDCKYGHDVFGSTLRLTLLRAPKAPDPEADMGHHEFTYSLFPHTGSFQEAGVIEEAYALNSPPRAILLKPGRRGRLDEDERWFFIVHREGVIIESVKKAEDEPAIILRLYEAYNSGVPARISTTLPVREVMLCDLLERDIQPLRMDREGDVVVPFRPFEIVTLKLRLQGR